MNWSPLQREMLEAMGLSPQRLVSAMPEEAPAEAARAAMREQGASGNVSQAAPEAARGRPAAMGALDTMTAALLRAAGFDRDATAREAVLAVCPAPHALRADPRAKRALWPRLRAMRKH